MSGSNQTELEKPARKARLTIGEILSRQELRVWILRKHQGKEAHEVAMQMGLDIRTVYDYLKKAHTKLASRRRAVSQQPEITPEQRIDQEVRYGIRCKDCNLLLPCRQDGLDGPCDAREFALTEEGQLRIMEFIRFVFHGGADGSHNPREGTKNNPHQNTITHHEDEVSYE